MDIEATMQLILEQQAQFAADIQMIKEVIRDGFQQINAVVLDLAASNERTNEIVAVLAERQVRTEESLQTLADTLQRHLADHK